MDRLEIPGDKLRSGRFQGSSNFPPGSRDIGYLEGQNITTGFRWASRVCDMPALARERVEMNVDVISGAGICSSRACQECVTCRAREPRGPHLFS